MKTTDETQLPLVGKGAAGDHANGVVATQNGEQEPSTEGEQDSSGATDQGQTDEGDEPSQDTEKEADNQAPASTSDVSPATAAAGEAPKAPEKPPRARRGPPADGTEEPRKHYILTTSKLNDTSGAALRRGQAVSVPVRRSVALLSAGRIREATKAEIETATKRYGRARIN